ncbi:MAG TPA: S8 family serine peptidase, partial [Pyrinomonadaceae bacterium]|nr:S8 family serine peptidase [Pyrinomonadaceae bacterium]
MFDSDFIGKVSIASRSIRPGRPLPPEKGAEKIMISRKKGLTVAQKSLSLVLLVTFFFYNSVFAISLNVESANTAGRYVVDLTSLAKANRLTPNLDLENEASEILAMASRKGRQAVVVTDSRAAAISAIETTARLIAEGSENSEIAKYSVLRLDTTALFSNSRSAAEANSILESILRESAKSPAILFIDDLSAFVGKNEFSSVIEGAFANPAIKIAGAMSNAAWIEAAQNEKTAKYFAPIFINTRTVNDRNLATGKASDATFRGDAIAPDLRQMMAKDPVGKTRLNLVVQAKSANGGIVSEILKSGQARVIRRFESSNTLVINAPLSIVNKLYNAGVLNYISPDRATLGAGHVENTTGTELVRNQAGQLNDSQLDGSGVGIAVLDSGIYGEHNGFKNSAGQSRVVASVNFTDSSNEDRYGHGTHVAGLAAGNSAIRGGAYRGIAPDANIISVKVLDDKGIGRTSWLLAGLDWVLKNRENYNIRVVNLSLGTLAIDSYTNDPVCRKVKELTAAGIVVVAAAGNLGRGPEGKKLYGTIHSPGNSPYAITVGASNTYGSDNRSDDTITTYSSRGPTRSFYVNDEGQRVYDNIIKPDIVAPGNKLISHRSPLAEVNPELAVAPQEGESQQD